MAFFFLFFFGCVTLSLIFSQNSAWHVCYHVKQYVYVIHRVQDEGWQILSAKPQMCWNVSVERSRDFVDM